MNFCLRVWQILLFTSLALKTVNSLLNFYSGEKLGRGRLKFTHGKVFVTKTDTNATAAVEKDVDELYFTQVLDHFNPHDRRTWQQRYFINREFFDAPDGPVFVIIAGEWTASPHTLTSDFHVDLAREMGALLFQVEHRYYGKSHPTEDTSVENLKYLSSRQALKDLESWTKEMRSTHNLEHNQWVAFGGSYSACLAAWYRLKFPEVVHVAVAVSGPIKLVADFKEYDEVSIASLFAKHSQDCVDTIKKATRTIKELVEAGHKEWEHLKNLFNMCEPLEKTELNVQNIYAVLSYSVAAIVQYNDVHYSEEYSGFDNTNIPEICAILTNVTEELSPIERYANMFQFLNERFNDGEWTECNDFRYESFIEYVSDVDWSSDGVSSAMRPWIYQTCTEFGYFQTSTWGKDSIFGYFPEEYYLRQCREIFGKKFTPKFVHNAIRETTEYYGGIEAFRHVTNVIFTNGKIDPWSALGITKRSQTNSGNTVLLIPDTAHCADIVTGTSLDSPSLIYARSVVQDSLEEYLHSHSHAKNASFPY